MRALPAADHLEWIRSQRASVSFLQTPAWGAVKADWRSGSLGWFDGEHLVGAGLVLYRPIPRLPWSLAYLPEGPSLPWLDATGQHSEPVQAWTAPLTAYLKSQRAFTIKMGPPVIARRWESATLKEAIAGGAAKRLRDLAPDHHDERATELADDLRAAGWQQETGDGAGFGDVQPRYVFQVPLAGRTLDELFAGFSQEWRRNIRKAQKNGVEVIEGGYDDLPDFHAAYLETAQRDRFTPRPLTYFQRMWTVMRAEDEARIRLFLAKREGEVLAATTMVTVGTHAWYSYGASTTSSREHRPSNAVQWAMIQAAHEAGAAVYDLRGISDTLTAADPLFGLIRFKLGTNGQAVEYIGEFDLPINTLLHRGVKAYLARR